MTTAGGVRTQMADGRRRPDRAGSLRASFLDDPGGDRRRPRYRTDSFGIEVGRARYSPPAYENGSPSS